VGHFCSAVYILAILGKYCPLTLLENTLRAKYNPEMVTQAIKKVQALGPSEHLPALLEPMKKDQKNCQEGMAKLLDSEYRAMERQAKRATK